MAAATDLGLRLSGAPNLLVEAAIARGALDAGCDFFAGYPITPATPILLTMMRESSENK